MSTCEYCKREIGKIESWILENLMRYPSDCHKECWDRDYATHLRVTKAVYGAMEKDGFFKISHQSTSKRKPQNRHIESSPRDEEKNALREIIPEKVRIQVWRHDDGKCVKCGSRERLEFDHIIPVSKGGSNTARNIELLCEKCNRAKGSIIM